MYILEDLIEIWNAENLDSAMNREARVGAALGAVCKRPYWTRLWIIQEVLSASRLELICGKKKLLWDHFFSVFHRFSDPASRLTPAYYISQKLSEQPGNGSNSLHALVDLCVACKSQCKDIRGRIYGLFGVSSDHIEESFKLVPDYSKRPVQVYINVFREYLTPRIRGNFYDKGYELGACRDEGHFNRTIMKIFKDPLWNNETKVFLLARNLGILNEVLEMRKTSGAIPIYATRKLVEVGPIISPATIQDESNAFSIFESKEQDRELNKSLDNWRKNVPFEPEFTTRNLSIFFRIPKAPQIERKLNARDFHRPYFIGGGYSRDEEFCIYKPSKPLSVDGKNLLGIVVHS